jgi:hypothetical protein
MRQGGIFEKVLGSAIWGIHWYDAQGRRHREKAGTKSAAIALYRKRKTEVLEGRKLPDKLRWAPVLLREIAHDALEYSQLHKRSVGDDRCRMRKILEWFSDRAAESITPREIEERLRSEQWKPATANRYRSLYGGRFFRRTNSHQNSHRCLKRGRERNEARAISG